MNNHDVRLRANVPLLDRRRIGAREVDPGNWTTTFMLESGSDVNR